MPVTQKLLQRPTFSADLVKQALLEGKDDHTTRTHLKQMVEQRAGDFEDTRSYDAVVQFLQRYDKDCYEVVPNTQAAVIGRAEVLEARITKVTDEKRKVDLTPPPPPPPSYRRDPLNITGKAPAGSKVEFYNASVPGRPSLGHTTADAHGNYAFELTDERKFEFGDQVGVVLVGARGEKGRPLIVPTEPFLITNTETTYFVRQGGAENVVRVDHTSREQALDKKTDARPPFFQAQLVDKNLEVPSQVEQPYVFTLIGKDDAVEPNSTITVKVGREEYKTTVDDEGRFALKVRDVAPGQRLSIQVRDINGHGIDIPARVPPVGLDGSALVAAMRTNPQENGIAIEARGLVPPGGALIVRNTQTGEMQELLANQQGLLKGSLQKLAVFDTFELAVRDVNGHISEQTELAVVLPNGQVKLASQMVAQEPDLAAAFKHVCGPPVDVLKGGVVDSRGPFLPLPGLPALPPFARLEVVRDGQVAQTLIADEHGKLDGMIRGVHVDDALTFRLRDAAGRLFPHEVLGFVVPAGHQASHVVGHVPPALARLDASTIGTGTLALDPAWLAPADIKLGAMVPTDFQARYAVMGKAGGAVLDAPNALFMHKHFPDVDLSKGAGITVTQGNGHKTLTVSVAGQSLSFGFDDTLNKLAPNIGTADLPRLTTALSATLAVVGAAVAQGKEPGDAAYDRAMGAAKTLLFLLDRAALASPAEAAQFKKVAEDVLGAKSGSAFPFELTDRGVVPPVHSRDPRLEVEATSSAAVNMLQARTLALGTLGSKPNVIGASRGLVDVSALSAAATFSNGTLSIQGKGLVAPGDELLVKIGDAVHRFVADKSGNLAGTIADVKPGSIVEIAQRGPKEVGIHERKLNPIAKAVVVDQPILGEGVIVPLDALTMRAPDARTIVDAALAGKEITGLPPLGRVVIAKDGKELATITADANGHAKGVQLKAGELVSVQLQDAAGRPFAPSVHGAVVGHSGSGNVRLDTDAMRVLDVVEKVGTGALAPPSFPQRSEWGKNPTTEIYAELNPFYGPSDGISEEHGRFNTKSAFPDGLLPELGKGPENPKLSMGNSVKMSAWQWEEKHGGLIGVSAGFYVENQRPDFAMRFDPRTGEVQDGGSHKPIVVPDGLPKMTTLLKSTLAFVALAQKNGSSPGDGSAYDLAARATKTVLVMFDRLIAQNPTMKTEIMAAMRAALPSSLPFDLAPNANTHGPAQPAIAMLPREADRTFWNAVDHADFQRSVQERKNNFNAEPLWSSLPTRPAYNSGVEPFFRRR